MLSYKRVLHESSIDVLVIGMGFGALSGDHNPKP